MLKKFLLVALILFGGTTAFSQVVVPAHIAEQLKSTRKFKDYARLMTRYLDSLKFVSRDSGQIAAIDKRYKKLARQLHYLEGRQDENGNIVNVSQRNMEAIEQLESAGIGQQSIHLGNWISVGPQHVLDSYGGQGIGRVDRIAFHPTNSSIMYAGTPAGGLWRSSTSGSVWSNNNAYIPSLGISGIVVSHENPNTLYVLTGDGDSNIGRGGFVEGFDYIRPSIGVLKSTDDGVSWRRTNLDIPGFYVGYKLIQSPVDADVLIAATSKGIYRTNNGGDNWTLVSADSARYYDLEWKPGSTAQLYACSENRFFISVSAGQTFAELTNRIPVNISAAERIALAVTPDNPDVVYVMAGANPSNTSQRRWIFRSTNSGGTFFQRNDATVSGGTVRYYWNIAADPNNYNNVVIGSLITSFSTDGASTFIRSGNIDNDNFDNYIHADIHDLSYHPITGALFIGSDGGVFTTTDHGVDINRRFLGMAATQFYHFDIDDDDENRIIGGAQDNGIMFKDDNTTFFKNYRDGDGYSISMPHGTGTYTVVSINTNTYFFPKDLPAHSTHWNLNLQNLVWYKPVATSYFDSTKYAGGTQILRWRAFGGSSGSPVSQFDANGRWALTNSPSNGNRLYAAGGSNWNDAGDQVDKKLARSDDNAATWTELQNNPGFPTNFSKITDISVNPGNSGRVCVSIGGYNAGVKVYLSTNAGDTWINLSGGLANLPVNCVAVNDNNDIYIGTDIGVFYRADGGTWMPFFNGLPKVPVTDLKIRNGIIYASTFGRGMFSSSVRGNCSPTLNITTNQSGRIYYEAQTITATGQIINGEGTEIYAKAVNETTLSPGFVANRGTEFRTWIGPCGTNGLPLTLVPASESKYVSKIVRDSTGIGFELHIPALVSILEIDDKGQVVSSVLRPMRLQEGKQHLQLSLLNPQSKYVMEVDGEVVRIN